MTYDTTTIAHKSSLKKSSHASCLVPSDEPPLKKSKSFIDQLLVNEHITNKVKSKRSNPLCAWLDCQKPYNSVPHSWMLEATLMDA